MKRIALLAVIGAGLMALPSTAAAQSSTCPNFVDAEYNPPDDIYVCVDTGGPSGAGQGGELVVNDSDGCSYINGWSANPPQGQGYAGICIVGNEPGGACTPDPDPEPPTGDANTGGCFEIKPAPDAVNEALNTIPLGLVTASFICGNTSGEDPKDTTRDGCAIP